MKKERAKLPGIGYAWGGRRAGVGRGGGDLVVEVVSVVAHLLPGGRGHAAVPVVQEPVRHLGHQVREQPRRPVQELGESWRLEQQPCGKRLGLDLSSAGYGEGLCLLGGGRGGPACFSRLIEPRKAQARSGDEVGGLPWSSKHT